MFRRAKSCVVIVRLHTLSSWLPKHKGFARRYVRESCYGFRVTSEVTSSIPSNKATISAFQNITPFQQQLFVDRDANSPWFCRMFPEKCVMTPRNKWILLTTGQQNPQMLQKICLLAMMAVSKIQIETYKLGVLAEDCSLCIKHKMLNNSKEHVALDRSSWSFKSVL